MFPDPVPPALTPTPKRDGRSLRRPLRLWLLRAVGFAQRATAPPERAAGGAPQRILLVRPDHLGDLLCMTPALRFLREQLPHAHLTALVGPWARDVLVGNSHLDALETLEFPGFTRRAKGSALAPYATLAAAAQSLRAGRYDAALILRFDHWWGAWLCAQAGVPRRVGYALPEVQPFLTEQVPYVHGRHEVAQNLRLAARLAGAPEPEATAQTMPLYFRASADDTEAARRLLAAQGIAEHTRFVALAPGSGAHVKLWRAEGFARVADALYAKRGWRAVIVGAGDAERAQAAQIAAQAQSATISLVDQTTLGMLATVLARATLAIGTDNGPMHLAAAMRTPGVHLFGPVSAQAFGPWGDPARHRVLTSALACIACNRLDYTGAETAAHPCVRLIGERAVLEAVEAVVS